MEASATGSLNYKVCLFILDPNFPTQSNKSLTLSQECPRPNGRTLVACQLMVGRLKNALKDDLEALKAGAAVGDQAGVPAGVRNENIPKTPKTPSKRKSKAADGDGSPKKRGRPAKKSAEKVEEDDMEPENTVENTVKEEPIDDADLGGDLDIEI